MTLDEINHRIAIIKARADDFEAAHRLEDMLMREFIIDVAMCNDVELSEKASAVLMSCAIEFQRVCA